MKLNLGCSDAHLMPAQGWVNVDLAPPCDEVADLAQPWPWADGYADEIRAIDIFEHIGNCRHMGYEVCEVCRMAHRVLAPVRQRAESGRIHVMNEAHRVLVPGGRLTIECPDAAKGAGQWQDPTHVTPWTPNGLQYFEDGAGAWNRFRVAYGITARFKVLQLTESNYAERGQVWKFKAILEAVKP